MVLLTTAAGARLIGFEESAPPEGAGGHWQVLTMHLPPALETLALRSGDIGGTLGDLPRSLVTVTLAGAIRGRLSDLPPLPGFGLDLFNGFNRRRPFHPAARTAVARD